MSIQILKLPEVMRRTALRRSSVYSKAANGGFPSPVKLGARASGWIEAEVEAWLAARVSDSRREEATNE